MWSYPPEFEIEEFFNIWKTSKKERAPVDKVLIYLQPVFENWYNQLFLKEGMEYICLVKLLNYYGDGIELLNTWLGSRIEFIHELNIYTWRVYSNFRRRPKMSPAALFKAVMKIIRLHLARDVGRYKPYIETETQINISCYDDKVVLDLEPLLTKPEAYIAILLAYGISTIEELSNIWPYSQGKVFNLKEAYCQKLKQSLATD